MTVPKALRAFSCTVVSRRIMKSMLPISGSMPFYKRIYR
jgi:hypothetical protein